LVQEASVWLFLDLGFNFHLEFRQCKFTNLPWYFFLNKLNFLYCLNKALFLSFLCILTLITIALSIILTIKCRLFARKERLAKRNKATLISLWSQGRETSADIGREFRPLRLVWWALPTKLKGHSLKDLAYFHNSTISDTYFIKWAMSQFVSGWTGGFTTAPSFVTIAISYWKKKCIFYEGACEWLLFNVKWAIFQHYHGKNK